MLKAVGVLLLLLQLVPESSNGFMNISQLDISSVYNSHFKLSAAESEANLSSQNQTLLRASIISANKKCPARVQKMCQRRFASSLKLSDAIFRNADTLRDAFNLFYRKPAMEDGLLPLCYLRAREFYQCLGSFYDACTDPFVMFDPAGGVSWNQAARVSFTLKSLAFDCVGGNPQLTSNFDCIMKSLKDSKFNDTFVGCVTTYLKDVNEKKKEVCTASQEFLDCVDGLFRGSCSSNEVAWWSCERFRVGFQVDGFCPSLDCNRAIITQAQKKSASQFELSKEWRQKTIGRGAFANEAKLKLYKRIGLDGRRRH